MAAGQILTSKFKALLKERWIMDVGLFCVDHNEEHSLKNGFSEGCPDGQWVRGHSALGRNLSLGASTHRH